MSKGISVREVALDALVKWEQEQAYSNLLINRTLEHSALNDKDRRLLTELVYGSIQRLNTLDWILDQLVKKGVSSLDIWVRQLLRMSIYQLIFLDRIPEHAAVNESVQIAKKRGHKGISGFVNGVLRSFLRQKGALLPTKDPKTMQEKKVAYSHPAWFIRRMEELYGVSETHNMCISNNTPPKISIRVNPLKITREAWIEEWIKETNGEASPSPLCSEGVIVSKGGNPAFTSLYNKGECTIQDESSMLVARVLEPRPGMRVLDACAAPGGKTTHISEIMKNNGSILACDVHPHKIKLIEANAQRLGTSIITTKCIDARELNSVIDGQFDAVLLDAPCSGLGVIRRKPDIKWRKSSQEIEALIGIQKELLDSLVPLLKPGGDLVYSTCTTEARENQEQIQSFLSSHPEFTWSPFDDLLPAVVREKAILQAGWVQILPHYFDTDGFFIARLKKS